MLGQHPLITRLLREEGVTSLEYGLIGLLVAIVIIVAVSNIGITLDSFLQAVQDGFQSSEG